MEGGAVPTRCFAPRRGRARAERAASHEPCKSGSTCPPLSCPRGVQLMPGSGRPRLPTLTRPAGSAPGRQAGRGVRRPVGRQRLGAIEERRARRPLVAVCQPPAGGGKLATRLAERRGKRLLLFPVAVALPAQLGQLGREPMDLGPHSGAPALASPIEAAATP